MHRNFNVDYTSTSRLNDKVGQALSVTLFRAPARPATSPTRPNGFIRAGNHSGGESRNYSCRRLNLLIDCFVPYNR